MQHYHISNQNNHILKGQLICQRPLPIVFVKDLSLQFQMLPINNEHIVLHCTPVNVEQKQSSNECLVSFLQCSMIFTSAITHAYHIFHLCSHSQNKEDIQKQSYLNQSRLVLARVSRNAFLPNNFQIYVQTPKMLPPHSLTIPNKQKRIQHYIYDTQTLLGKGCFSTVHPGHHITTNSKVAIKVVKLSSLVNHKMKQLLDQETQIICSLNHKNIIRCYQVLRSDNHCYFVTEICEQGSLEKKLSSNKMLSEDEIRCIVKEVYQGLRYLEIQGIVHRDIKLANVFVGQGVAKIADFGFAVRTRNQFNDIKIGSPLYMAPQSLRQGRYSHKSDVWAFGVLIYELVHGKTPLSHCKTQLDLSVSIEKQLTQSDVRSELSPQLKQLIINCLQVRQQNRITVGQIGNLAYFKHSNNKLNQIGRQNAVLRNLSPSYQPTRPLFLSNVIYSPKKPQRMNTRVLTYFRSPNRHNLQLSKNQSSTHLKPTLYNHKKPTLYNDKKEAEMKSSTNSTISTVSQTCLLKGKIHFQECIGLIHFCRLAFRLIEQNLIIHQYDIKGLTGRILEDLQAKLRSNEILFTAKQLQEKRDAKLRQVIYEYQQKYQLESCCQYPNLTQIVSSCNMHSHSLSLLKQQPQLHLFQQYCNKLQNSINQLQYRVFSNEIGPLQSCLLRLSKSP